MAYRDDHWAKIAGVALPLATGIGLGLIIARQRAAKRK